ncbi:MAG: hypothetical protein KC736_01835 [Candidatus Moranbacteria bacterium]|nr:hypothetical protein [Candidatus Moranbacteria bacterium]
MAEDKKNLEPITEDDMDLEGRLKGVHEEVSLKEGVEPARENGAQEGAVEQVSEISKAEKESAYAKILANVKSAQQSKDEKETVSGDAKKVKDVVDPEKQIATLIDIAMQKDVVYAVKVAQTLDSYYVLDQLHDKLVTDKLYEALRAKGLIEE